MFNFNILKPFFFSVFILRHQKQCKVRNWTYYNIPKVRNVNHGSESVRYLDPKI